MSGPVHLVAVGHEQELRVGGEPVEERELVQVERVLDHHVVLQEEEVVEPVAPRGEEVLHAELDEHRLGVVLLVERQARREGRREFAQDVPARQRVDDDLVAQVGEALADAVEHGGELFVLGDRVVFGLAGDVGDDDQQPGGVRAALGGAA